jgi:hypothetical protein
MCSNGPRVLGNELLGIDYILHGGETAEASLTEDVSAGMAGPADAPDLDRAVADRISCGQNSLNVEGGCLQEQSSNVGLEALELGAWWRGCQSPPP